MKTSRALFLICLGAFLLRVALIGFVRHPGISDPNHYYNQGRELVGGNGFQIDYIWQYYNPPEGVTHPEDWWLPLTGALAAGGMALFGVNVQAALLPFVILGSLLPVLGYCAARQFRCSESSSLFAAAAVAVLPEFTLNSLRTNTLIPNTALVTAALLLLIHWLKNGDARALLASGVMAGLAYLTRSENSLLLPTFLVTLAVYAIFARTINRAQWPAIVLTPVIALAVVSPWLLRNTHVFGWLTPPNQQRIFFWTDFRDLYAYDRDLTWHTMLAAQGWGGIIGKRVFEMAASAKVMVTSLDVFLPVPILGGLILLVARRDRDRLLMLAPTAILLAGIFFFYTVMAPYFSQGGSFKKAYLGLVPMLIPAGAYALEQAVPEARLRLSAMGIVIALMTANAVETMRADIRFTNNYLDIMEKVADTLNTLPDANGDGDIALMAQDPFMVNFLGIKAVAIPMEDRDTVLAVARRYGADYLLMPPARPSLDPLYEGTETDPRFVRVVEICCAGMVIYGFDYNPQ
jgi:hypothetical protein